MNYIDLEKGQEYCDSCMRELGRSPKSKPTQAHRPVRVISPTNKGKSVYFVFQGGAFNSEMRAGYIQAPLESAGGFVPHHWERLAYLRAGDVILHCVGGVILAVSVVKGVSYQATNHLGQKCRRVDCDYHIFKNSLNLDNYRSEIIHYCANRQYQPFNKNGTGNQGYLFDINKDLAVLFLRDIVNKNSHLSDISFIKELL